MAATTTAAVVKSIGTHDGKFHADEVFACVLLHMTMEFAGAAVVRTRDEKVLKGMDAVVDVGGVYDPRTHRYDHHQPTFHDTFSPDHKTLLSSAGLAYKHFAKEIIAARLKPFDAELVHRLYRKIYDVFVESFDGHDNGIPAYPSDIRPAYQRPWDIFAQVNVLNPAWNEQNVDSNVRFQEAMKLMRETFERVLNFYINSWLPARTVLEQTFAQMPLLLQQGITTDRRILLLERHCPWMEHLFELEREAEIEGQILYVIFQDQTSQGWRIQAVPKAVDSFESRHPLPQSWRGLRERGLDEVSGIEGCVFVHRSGFIGGHTTQKGAIQMATFALKEQEGSQQ